MHPADTNGPLATNRIEAISIRNQFLSRVIRFVHHGGRAVVEVDAGVPLLVEVSSGSFHRLGLAIGKPVWCLIKANAIQVF